MGGRSLLDLLLDPPRPAASTRPEHDGGGSAGAAMDDGSALLSATRKPGSLTVTIDLTSAARPVAAGLARARDVDPLDTLLRGLRRSVGLVDSVSRQVLVAGGPLSPLPLARATNTRFEVVSIHGARAAALALGGSRNDLLVAATAAGLGLYHERLGLSCPELRLAMPASRHRDGSAGGNWFAPTRVEIPTESEHPGPQFGVVSERLARARSEPAVRLTNGLASAISHLPTRVLLPALHAQANSVDFVATSLPGIRQSRQLCGATIEGSYPFGPRLRCLANVTASGNEDRLDIGIGLDPVAIAEPDVFIECLTAAFGRFLPAGHAGSRSRARSTTAG
jgi:hypothetical protein